MNNYRRIGSHQRHLGDAKSAKDRIIDNSQCFFIMPKDEYIKKLLYNPN